MQSWKPLTFFLIIPLRNQRILTLVQGRKTWVLEIFRFNCFLKVCWILLYMKKYGPRKTEPLKRILHSTFVQKYFMKDFANHNTRNKGKKMLEKGLTMNCNTLNQPTPSVAVYSSPLSFLLKTVEHLLFERMCFFFLSWKEFWQCH